MVTGIFLGLTAAFVVWWLERFQSERLIGEVETYLASHDAFSKFLKERDKDNGGRNDADAGTDGGD